MNKLLEGKKLLILGGIKQMIPLCNVAHEMGLLVYQTDILEDVPLRAIADKSFTVSATDVDGVVQLIKDENIDGVLTGYVDLLLPYYAEICQKAGLPCYATKNQFNTITNKDTVKKICSQYDIPIPYTYTIEEIKNDDVKYPVIVKPADGSGSRGITVCKSKSDIEEAIKYALSFSKVGKCVIEDYLVDGTVLMQYYLQDGEIGFCCAIDGFSMPYYPDKQKMDVCGIAPSVFTDHYLNDLHNRYCDAFKSINLKDGPMEINTFVGHGEMHLGDIGYRLCGGRANYLVDEIAGINLYENLITFAITGKSSDCRLSEKFDPYLKGKYEGLVCYFMDVGKVSKIVGLENLNHIKGLYNGEVYIKEGFEIREEDRGKLIQVVGRMRILSDSLEELESLMYQTFEAVDFLDESGRSLKINNALYSECIARYKNKMCLQQK